MSTTKNKQCQGRGAKQNHKKLEIIDARELHPANCQESKADLRQMKALCKKHPRLVNTEYKTDREKTADGWITEYITMNPLHSAILEGHFECVRALLSCGANPEASYVFWTIYSHSNKPFATNKYSPIMLAIRNCHADKIIPIIEILIENGASVNARNRSKDKDPNFLPYCYYIDYVMFHKPAVMRCLLEHGAYTDYYCTYLQNNEQVWHNTSGFFAYGFDIHKLEIFKLFLLHGCQCIFWDSLFLRRIASDWTKFESRESFIVEEKLIYLEIYRQFGGDLLRGFSTHWYFPSFPSLPSLVDILVLLCHVTAACSEPQMVGRMAELTHGVREMTQTPLSLQSWSRLAVFRRLGREHWRKVDSLPVPKPIINYLKFTDLDEKIDSLKIHVE